MTVEEKIVVLAKAMPATSPTHGEITCVAGIAEDDKWRRLHPVPTNLLSKSYFMKFSIIVVDVEPWVGQHQRPEDRHLVTYKKSIGRITDMALQIKYLQAHLDHSVRDILSAGRSLGIIKPEITDFYRDANGRLRYKFNDSSGDAHNLVCREWEALALAKKYPEPNDFEKIRSKFFDFMNTRDTYFVIGTTADNVTKMVVAVHYPKV